MLRNRMLFAVTLITLAGSLLRFFQLDSIPPGLHYDVAANAILVEEIAFHGQRPLFIEAYAGKEVLFFYFAALLFRLIGSSVFALRLAAALWGLLAVPTTFFAVRQIFRHEEKVNWMASLCSILLAFSFMHLVWSRFGLRAITQPVIQALALGFLFRGLRRSMFTDFALAGLFTGLSAYTYLAARAFPIPIAISLATFIIAYYRQHRKVSANRFRSPFPATGLTLFILTSLITLIPLVLFFVEHPQVFLARVSQIAVREGESALLWRSITGALGMLFISGEPYERFNVPGKPIFDPALGALFILGLGVTVHRLIRSRASAPGLQPVALAAEVMLLSWVPIFLLPTALALHDVFPSNVRAFGLLPLVFVYPARGLLKLSAWSRETRNVQHALRIGHSLVGKPMVLFILLASITFLHTSYIYFHVWANQDTQHITNDGDLTHAAEYLNTLDLRNVSVYMSAIHYRHPTVAYLAEDYNRIRWLTGAASLAVPAEGAALYVFPQSALPPDEWLRFWGTAVQARPSDPNGKVDYYVYHFESNSKPPLHDFTAAHATFNHMVEITGYRVVEDRAGQTLTVDLRLGVINPPDLKDYRVVADLVDQWGMPWTQGFNDSYPSEQWKTGDTIIARLTIPIPVGMPPGKYTLSVTLYSPGSGINLPATNEAGTIMATASIGPVSVSRAADYSLKPKPQHESDAQVGALRLFGYDLPETSRRPGEELPLTLYWIAEKEPRQDYQIRIVLGDVTIASGAPVHNTYSTMKWQAGEIITDRYNIRLPRNFPARDHKLSLTVSDGVASSEALVIGHVTVMDIERMLTPPTPSQQTDITLGNWLKLIGYDLETSQTLQLRLHWQALTETNTDYSVFVHVRDASNQIVAQHDSGPANGSYPTSMWVAGEFVEDAHSFDLPSGHYSLAVGMYLPTTGERLALPDAQDELLIEQVVIP